MTPSQKQVIVRLTRERSSAALPFDLQAEPSAKLLRSSCSEATSVLDFENQYNLSTPMHIVIWILCAAFALTAGITDLRWRRIPNWLTYPAAPLAVALHVVAGRWPEAKLSLEGLGLGLALLLPFWLLRSLGGGDWKLVGALGAFVGIHHLIDVLIATLLANALMAIVFIFARHRVWRTLRNIGRIFAAFFRLHLPGKDLTIDSPEAAKVPFGVAAAVAVLLYVGWHWQGPF